jgi:hypothetical protein
LCGLAMTVPPVCPQCDAATFFSGSPGQPHGPRHNEEQAVISPVSL